MKSIAAEKTMTVKEVAESLGVSDRYIRDVIAKLFPDKMENGKTTYLSHLEVTKIKMEIEKNPHLERSFQVTTGLERKIKIAEGYKLLMEEIEELKAQNETLHPKADSYDRFIEADHLLNMKQVADILNFKGMGRNNLLEFLRSEGIFSNNICNWNLPYREFIEAGYFEVKEVFIDAMQAVKLQPYVTQKGLDFIKVKLQGMINKNLTKKEGPGKC